MKHAFVVVAVLTACGGGSSSSDAQVPTDDVAVAHVDAMIDAPPPPPGMVRVVVTALSTGAPQAGVRVLFSHDDDSLAGDVMTDANGHATATLDTGYITVITNSPSGPSIKYLTTVLGVHAGEEIDVGPDPSIHATTGNATIVAMAHAGDPNIHLYTPCSQSNGNYNVSGYPAGYPLPLHPDASCDQGAGILATTLVSVAGGEQDPAAFAYLAAQNLAVGQTYNLPAWVDAQATTVTVAQDNTVQLAMYATPVSDAGRLLQVKARFANQTSTNRSYTTVRPAFATQLEWLADATLFDSGTGQTSTIYGRQHAVAITAATAAVTLPFSSLSLRWMLPPLQAINTTKHPVVTWRATGSDTAGIAWSSATYQSMTGKGIIIDVWGPAPASGTGTGTVVLPAFSDPDLQASSVYNTARFKVLDIQGKTFADVHTTIARDFANAQYLDRLSSPIGSYTMQPLLDRYPAATSIRMSASR